MIERSMERVTTNMVRFGVFVKRVPDSSEEFYYVFDYQRGGCLRGTKSYNHIDSIDLAMEYQRIFEENPAHHFPDIWTGWRNPTTT
jgi:hypothetical protein